MFNKQTKRYSPKSKKTNRDILFKKVCSKTGYPLSDVRAIGLEIFNTMQQELLNGKAILIPKFFYFYPFYYVGRTLVNIKTKVNFDIPSRFIPKVVFHKAFSGKMITSLKPVDPLDLDMEENYGK